MATKRSNQRALMYHLDRDLVQAMQRLCDDYGGFTYTSAIEAGIAAVLDAGHESPAAFLEILSKRRPALERAHREAEELAAAAAKAAAEISPDEVEEITGVRP